jgi:hypothetical protein
MGSLSRPFAFAGHIDQVVCLERRADWAIELAGLCAETTPCHDILDTCVQLPVAPRSVPADVHDRVIPGAPRSTVLASASDGDGNESPA